MLEAELIHFRAYNSQENAERELTATFNPTFPNADGFFYINGLSGISGFKESATGVGENDFSADVNVYPNPATDVLNIMLTGYRTIEGIGTLTTAEGKVMKTFTLKDNVTKVEVKDLPPGIYILKIESTENVVSKRVVIR